MQKTENATEQCGKQCWPVIGLKLINEKNTHVIRNELNAMFKCRDIFFQTTKQGFVGIVGGRIVKEKLRFIILKSKMLTIKNNSKGQ